ncbi:hypothetical protein ACH5RR_015765 [Cinchona calisaya]|uniref:Uncharacterized protein n=1 Tax=Cinchona calisaya TaxID=153742 RepID=A0ABD2ZU06_9GENT
MGKEKGLGLLISIGPHKRTGAIERFHIAKSNTFVRDRSMSRPLIPVALKSTYALCSGSLIGKIDLRWLSTMCYSRTDRKKGRGKLGIVLLDLVSMGQLNEQLMNATRARGYLSSIDYDRNGNKKTTEKDPTGHARAPGCGKRNKSKSMDINELSLMDVSHYTINLTQGLTLIEVAYFPSSEGKGWEVCDRSEAYHHADYQIGDWASPQRLGKLWPTPPKNAYVIGELMARNNPYGLFWYSVGMIRIKVQVGWREILIVYWLVDSLNASPESLNEATRALMEYFNQEEIPFSRVAPLNIDIMNARCRIPGEEIRQPFFGQA